MPAQVTKPCLVQTGQGFSLSYNGRFLYSKYAPQKAIVQTVANLVLLPGTLILCASPCLWYGLSELLAKLPENSFVLGIEADENLHELAAKGLEDFRNRCSCAEAQTPMKSAFPLDLLAPDELLDIAEIMYQGKTRHGSVLPPVHTFRRALLLEMSGGTALHAELYRQIDGAAENAIASFWKNRLTLTKLGRLFSRNVFHNLAALPRSTPLSAYLKKISRPIIVFGAGESAETTIKSLSPEAWKDYFVLAVDAALPVLTQSGIQIDGIVAVESQLAIEKAYIGSAPCLMPEKGQIPILFADISSRQQVTNHTQGEVCYFASKFADTGFLSDLQAKEFFPPQIPALGSVGLTATYLSLQLRKSNDIPVYVTGLDFSFSLGLTHTRGAPAHIARLSKSNRLAPPANYDAAFRIGAHFAAGKNGCVCTDTALSGYAQQFAGFFCGVKNLFDIGKSGLSLGLPFVTFGTDGHMEAENSLHEGRKCNASQKIKESGQGLDRKEGLTQHVEAFFEQERKALLRLKDLLMHGESVKSTKMSVQEEIGGLLARREYLYLHFPDGYECRPSDLGFLKRVRNEIDFFLKDIESSGCRCV